MNKSIFSRRLKIAMDNKEINQVDLCRITKISTPLMCNYLKGNYMPKEKNLTLIANALSVSKSWLSGYDSSAEVTPSGFSDKEIRVMIAYKNQPEKQPEVDHILGVEESPLSLHPQEQGKLIAHGSGQSEAPEVDYEALHDAHQDAKKGNK